MTRPTHLGERGTACGRNVAKMARPPLLTQTPRKVTCERCLGTVRFRMACGESYESACQP